MFDCNADLRVICERRGQSPFPSQVSRKPLPTHISYVTNLVKVIFCTAAPSDFQHSEKDDDSAHGADKV